MDRVLVVGAGIAGLAVASALQRQGITVEVFERHPDPPDGGLGLNLPGNAIAALRALGLGDELASLGAPLRRREYRNRRGRLLFAVDEQKYWGDLGPSRCVSRSSLHAALRGTLAPSTVRFGAKVRGVQASGDGAELLLSDGSRAAAGVLIGADGVHSVVRAHVAPGQRVQSAILSRASWRFVTRNPGVDCWTAWTGGAGTVLLIPMGGDRLYGWVSGDREAGFPEVSASFGGFPRLVRDTLAAAAADDPPPLHSPLEEVRPAVWTKGPIVLVGDAAHATAPVWAQGAALAVEDALVLADVLTDRGNWSRAGGEFERRRRARVEHVRAMTDRFSRVARLPPLLRDLTAPLAGPRTYRTTYDRLREPVG